MGITVRPTSSDCCENNSKKKKKLHAKHLQSCLAHGVNKCYPYNFDIIIFKFKWKDTFQTKID